MLKQQIKSDATDALKKNDQLVIAVLRMALAAITSKEKEKRYKVSKEKPILAESELIKESEINDDEIIVVLSSEVKKRKDAIALYDKGGRQELAEKERKEIEILKKYLPEQISYEDLKKLVKESLKKVGATEIKDTGKIMADLMPKIKGRADGGEVGKIIKELLSNK
jgi:uncharacterized protein YqeY